MICPICGKLISKRFPVHECKPVFITGDYPRKKVNGHYYRAETISETTHVELHFVIYTDPSYPEEGYVSYTGTFLNSFLFTLLKRFMIQETTPGRKETR